MKPEKYDRTISLYCPICASSEFEFESDDSEMVTCAGCNTEFSREDLISENAENIDAHTKEIADEVSKDIEKQLKDMFKGSKLFKVK